MKDACSANINHKKSFRPKDGSAANQAALLFYFVKLSVMNFNCPSNEIGSEK